MNSRLAFVISLMLILVASWVNIVYFGYAHRNHFGPMVNQFVHIALLSFTGVVGFFNWRKKEKWLRMIWVCAYVFVYLLVGVLLITYLVSSGHVQKQLAIVISQIRNGFTGPIPFLVFFLLNSISTRIALKEK